MRVFARRSRVLAGLLAACLPWACQGRAGPSQGRAVYERHCYPCHGYAGDARTLARSYLDPPPRDFTRADPESLDRPSMIDAVTRGRPGTAMVGFGTVLSREAIASVVDYIRAAFMGGGPRDGRYHTQANGWPRHQRYAAAFPFATGEIPLDTPWEVLTPEQRRGRRLYMGACISCHDRARVLHPGAVWALRPLSYPRGGHTPGEVDAYSGASPYALHDRAPAHGRLDARARRGEALYREHCAFCHAADGTGRNWIGSFIEPHPRDLTASRVAAMADEDLLRVIREGVPDSAMPAWRQVLGDREILAIMAYIRQALTRGGSPPVAARERAVDR